MPETFNLTNFINSNQGIFFILISVIGWIFVYCLNLRQQKRGLQNEYKMKIYDNLSDYKYKVDNALSRVSVPGIIMAKMRVDDVINFLNGKGYLAPLFKSADECWYSHMEELRTSIDLYNDSIHGFMCGLEKWKSIMPKLDKAIFILFKELNLFSKELSDYLTFIQTSRLDNPNIDNWKKVVNKNSDLIYKRVEEIGGFLWDSMNLVHNELLGQVFGNYIKERDLRHLNKKVYFRVLTNDEIKVVQYDPEEK